MKAFLYFVLTYVILSVIFFGSPIKPLGFILLCEHLFWENWLRGVAWAAIPALLLSSIPRLWPGHWRLAVFIGSWMMTCVVPTGLYADWARRNAIAEFSPDLVMQSSFFQSLHEIPNDFQFYVHTAVMKDCVPYLWSYRRMRFSKLNHPDVAINVLPRHWVEQCNIERVPQRP